MLRKWLAWINIAVCAGAIILLLLASAYWLSVPEEILIADIAAQKTEPPKSFFVQPEESYNAIGEPLLTLKFAPMSMQLPDLKRFLIYYGKNGRPDADPVNYVMHFVFAGNKTPHSATPGERLYLSYDKKATPAQYIFSPNNEPTPLWIEASAQGNEAIVKVGMKDENENMITQPTAFAQFNLPEKEYARVGGVAWDIGKWRVDGTLLARQKAKWYGQDRFLEKHGGKEYAELAGKQRIDFGENNDNYSVFVGLNDCLIWMEGGRWKVVKPGLDSKGYPLLIIKKIEDRVMGMEMWDVEGKGKIALNLLKSAETWAPQSIQQGFKFVGARTRTQFVFEVNKERMLISPQDWLVLTDSGWKKLSTNEDIDNYVDRNIVGPLFVFDGVERREDHQVLMGTIFNNNRTDMQTVELIIQQGAPVIEEEKRGQNKHKQNGKPSQISKKEIHENRHSRPSTSSEGSDE